MGCRQSKDATLARRASSVAVPLRPTTPSFHAQESRFWTSTSNSQANEFREELPSFVVSDSADLVCSSDGEAVHGMVSAFTFSFIQVSETSSVGSSLSLSLEGSRVDSVASDDALTTPPTPPESLTFAMTGDPIELTPIPEEGGHSGPREGVEASNSTSMDEQSQAATEPDAETSPAAPEAVDVDSNGAITESTVSGSLELLLAESEASGLSRRSAESSNTTGTTGHSVTASELSEGGEYMVTETGAIVRHNSAVIDPTPDTSADEASSLAERESIDIVAESVVQQVIDDAVSGVAAPSPGAQQPRGRGLPVTSSSLEVEPSSTGIFNLSVKTQPSDTVPGSEPTIPAGWTYAIVGTSTENGVVLYHVQLTDEVGDNAKWSVPLLRRYSRFNEMYSKLKESKLAAADKLPKLPRAGVLQVVRGRQSKSTIHEREQRFSELLRYIAQHRELHTSVAFQRFLSA